MKKLILLAIFLLFTQTAQAGLVSWWKLDEASWNGTANEVVDSYGTNHGTANGGTSCTTVVGKDNRAGSFDGTNDYVDCGTGIGKPANYTILAWIKPSITGEIDGIIASGPSTLSYANSWGLRTTTLMKVSVSNGTTSQVYDAEAWNSINYPSGQWTFIAGTVDGTTIRFYRNGIQIGSGVAQTVQNTGTVYSLSVGRMGGSDLYYFNGTIDEVRIYNHALTADEVAHQYFLGSQTRLR